MLCGGVVHIVRANVVDVAVFFGTAVLILVLQRRDLPPHRPPQWLWRWWTVPVAAGVVGLVVAAQPRTSPAVELALAAVGVAALVVVLRAGVGSPLPPRSTRRSWVWAVPLLAGALFELGNFLTQPDPHTDNLDHPTLSALVDPLLDGSAVRAVVTVAWVLAGWALVRVVTERGSGP